MTCVHWRFFLNKSCWNVSSNMNHISCLALDEHRWHSGGWHFVFVVVVKFWWSKSWHDITRETLVVTGPADSQADADTQCRVSPVYIKPLANNCKHQTVDERSSYRLTPTCFSMQRNEVDLGNRWPKRRWWSPLVRPDFDAGRPASTTVGHVTAAGSRWCGIRGAALRLLMLLTRRRAVGRNARRRIRHYSCRRLERGLRCLNLRRIFIAQRVTGFFVYRELVPDLLWSPSNCLIIQQLGRIS